MNFVQGTQLQPVEASASPKSLELLSLPSGEFYRAMIANTLLPPVITAPTTPAHSKATRRCTTCQTTVQISDWTTHLTSTHHLVAKSNSPAKRRQLRLNERNIGYRLLTKAGWTEGQGLGQCNQGSVHPIAIQLKFGQQGLGYGSQGPKRITHLQPSIDACQRKAKLKSSATMPPARPWTRKEICRQHDLDRRQRIALLAYMNRD